MNVTQIKDCKHSNRK